VSCHACPCLQVNRDNSVQEAAFVPVCCNRPLYSQHRRPTKSQCALHLMSSTHTFANIPACLHEAVVAIFNILIHPPYTVPCVKLSRLEPKATHSETSFVLCELCFGLSYTHDMKIKHTSSNVHATLFKLVMTLDTSN